MSTVTDSPRITPFLWFDGNAEEAVNFYLGIFKNSRRTDELRNMEEGAGKGAIITLAFELDGQKFIALNGGPNFKFNEAVSFVVSCDSQQEIDDYWEQLSAGGTEVECGWLKDKFGLAWQIVPRRIGTLIKSPKAMAAMMKMKKLNLAELEQANQP